MEDNDNQDRKQFWKKVYAEAGIIPPEESPPPLEQENPSPVQETAVESSLPSSEALPLESRIDTSSAVGGSASTTSVRRDKPNYGTIIFGVVMYGIVGAGIGVALYHSFHKVENLCKETLSQAGIYTPAEVNAFCEDPCNQEQFYTLYYSLNKDNSLGEEALKRTAIRQAKTLVEKVKEVCNLPKKQ